MSETTSEASGLRLVLSREQISEAIDRLASDISKDYLDKDPLLITALKGGFVFVADLVRRLDMALEVDFVTVSSYGSSTAPQGQVEIHSEPRSPVAGRHVLVVEDIVDTGLTTNFLLRYLGRQNPASLRLCALLDKAENRKAAVRMDYRGIEVPNVFLVGYGLDLDQRYRNLPEVYALS